jgi:tubby-related protein 1
MQQPSLQQQPRAPKVLVDINITDMKSWLHSPVPEGYILRCTIERDNSGMGHLYPKYHLHLSESGQYLMTAKRLAMQKTAKYILSYDKTDLSRRSPKYLGLIRSNFLGTEFMVYDPGLNPKVTQDLSLLRSQLALITFESNVLQTRSTSKCVMVSPTQDTSRAARNHRGAINTLPSTPIEGRDYPRILVPQETQ